MVKICQTCGDEGFYEALMYCTECWNTVEHIYCLGLSLEDICDDFSWICDSCASIGEQLAKVVMFGDNLGKMTKSPSNDPTTMSEQGLPACATPVIGPIWRGECDIFGLGSYYGYLNGVEVFMPRTSYSKIVKVVGLMQLSLKFRMQSRKDIWPENFSELGAAGYAVGVYIFPQFSRSEEDYDNLVEYMICNDIAMTSDMGNLELTVFTSLELLPTKRQRIQGKYYLWGMFKAMESRENQASMHSKPNLDRNRISRGLRANGCVKNPSLRRYPTPSGNSGSGSKQGTKRKKTKTVLCNLKCSHVPKLSRLFKRTRSKRCRISENLDKWADIGEVTTRKLSAITDNQGKYRNDCVTSEKIAVKSQQKVDPLRTSSTIDEDVTIPEKCLHQPAVEFRGLEVVNHEVNHTEKGDKPAVIIRGEEESNVRFDSVDDSSHSLVKQRAHKVEDMSNDKIYQDLGPVSLLMESTEAVTNSILVLTSPSREIIPHQGAMSGCDVLHFPTNGSPIPNMETNVGETSSYKIFTQVGPCELEPDLEPTLVKLVDSGEIAHNSITEETIEREQASGETGMMLDVSRPNENVDSTSQEEDLCICSSNMVVVVDGHVEDQVRGPNEALVGIKEPVPRKDQPESLSVLLSQMPKQQTAIRNGSQVTSPLKNACSTRSLDYQEESELQEVKSAAHEEINACSNGEPASIILNSMINDHEKHIECEIPRVNEASAGDAQMLEPSSRITQTSAQKDTCSTPLIDNEEESEVPEPNPATVAEINPCSIEACTSLPFNSLVHNHGSIIGDEVLGLKEASSRDGPSQLDSTHSENGTCTTLLLDVVEESCACNSPSTTCPLSELNKGTTVCGTRDTEDTSDMTASILKMTGDYHDTSSDGVHKQVGQYKIKADLVPILEKILMKYGDIAQDCSIVPELLLQNICKAIQDLESVGIRGLRRHHLSNLRNTLKLGEALGIDVKLLVDRTEYLEKIAAQIGGYPALKSKLHQLEKDAESAEQKLNLKRTNLSKLKEDLKSMSGDFDLLKEQSEKLD